MVKTAAVRRARTQGRDLTSNVHQHKQLRDQDHVFAKFLPEIGTVGTDREFASDPNTHSGTRPPLPCSRVERSETQARRARLMERSRFRCGQSGLQEGRGRGISATMTTDLLATQFGVESGPRRLPARAE
jgi:hypothetical protein